MCISSLHSHVCLSPYIFPWLVLQILVHNCRSSCVVRLLIMQRLISLIMYAWLKRLLALWQCSSTCSYIQSAVMCLLTSYLENRLDAIEVKLKTAGMLFEISLAGVYKVKLLSGLKTLCLNKSCRLNYTVRTESYWLWPDFPVNYLLCLDVSDQTRSRPDGYYASSMIRIRISKLFQYISSQFGSINSIWWQYKFACEA